MHKPIELSVDSRIRNMSSELFPQTDRRKYGVFAVEKGDMENIREHK
jgi:hypothetical protein